MASLEQAPLQSTDWRLFCDTCWCLWHLMNSWSLTCQAQVQQISFLLPPPHSVIIPTNIFLKEKEVCMIFQLPQLTWFKNAEICLRMILRSKCHGLCLFSPHLLGGRDDPVGLFWPQTVQAHSPPLPQAILTLKVLPRLAFSTVLLL